MGIKSAPEVYQQRMEQVFEGLPGVKVIMDESHHGWIHGRTGPEHDTRFRAVLQRAKDNNLRLKKKKSDRKPLEAIMKKPLHVAPLRLQRMWSNSSAFQESLWYTSVETAYI